MVRVLNRHGFQLWADEQKVETPKGVTLGDPNASILVVVVVQHQVFFSGSLESSSRLALWSGFLAS